MYQTAQLFSRLFGDEWAIHWLRAKGCSAIVWEFVAAKVARKMHVDPTYTYTFAFSFDAVRLAELAQEAKAFEWAYISATDAIAILEWLEETNDPIFAQAMLLAETAEEHIDTLRAQDLKERQQNAKLGHNRREELQFKRSLARRSACLWESIGRPRRPKITERPH